MVDVVMKRNPATGRELQEKDFNERKRVVRVVPRTPDIRKYLKHPLTRVGFLAEGSSEWPNDQFTRNRIREGDVSIEAAEQKAKEPDQQWTDPETGAKLPEDARAAPEPARGDPTVDPDQTTAPNPPPVTSR